MYVGQLFSPPTFTFYMIHAQYSTLITFNLKLKFFARNSQISSLSILTFRWPGRGGRGTRGNVQDTGDWSGHQTQEAGQGGGRQQPHGAQHSSQGRAGAEQECGAGAGPGPGQEHGGEQCTVRHFREPAGHNFNS